MGLPWVILPSKKVIIWKSGNGLILSGVDELPVISRKRVPVFFLSIVMHRCYCSMSFLKPFSESGFLTRSLLQNHCEPFKWRLSFLPAFRLLNDLLGRGALAGIFSGTPRVLMGTFYSQSLP